MRHKVGKRLADEASITLRFVRPQGADESGPVPHSSGRVRRFLAHHKASWIGADELHDYYRVPIAGKTLQQWNAACRAQGIGPECGPFHAQGRGKECLASGSGPALAPKHSKAARGRALLREHDKATRNSQLWERLLRALNVPKEAIAEQDSFPSEWDYSAELFNALAEQWPMIGKLWNFVRWAKFQATEAKRDQDSPDRHLYGIWEPRFDTLCRWIVGELRKLPTFATATVIVAPEQVPQCHVEDDGQPIVAGTLPIADCPEKPQVESSLALADTLEALEADKRLWRRFLPGAPVDCETGAE